METTINYNKYKYIIIHTITDEFYICESLRDIEKSIREMYPEKGISHNAISERFKSSEHKYFPFYELIVRELVW